MSSLQEIWDVLKNSSRVFICGHVIPDGDCLGSVAALGMALEQLGKQVVLASPDPIPQALSFLPGAQRFFIGVDNPSDAPDFDTFVVLDCSVPERLGSLRRLLERDVVVVNIDHHMSSHNFAHYNYLDPAAAATGEILCDLIEIMGAGLSRDVATCLYVAIVTDTGSFQYENTSPETLRRAARLMESGINASSINTRLYEEKPIQNIRLLGAALESMNLSTCGRVAWTVVERDLLRRFSAGDEHTDGLVNFLRTIRGVEVAILIREIERCKYKVGFRSKGKVNVHNLASRLGGGGHVRASGCILAGNLREITERVIDEAVMAVSGADQPL